MTLEDGFERFARACGKPSILLCDRGLMDGSVYMPPEEWACLVRADAAFVTMHDALRCVDGELLCGAIRIEPVFDKRDKESRRGSSSHSAIALQPQ